VPVFTHQPFNMNLLIIEDNIQINNTVARNFTAENFVVQVYSAKEALTEINKQNKFDVIISDWFLGIDDGLELCKKIRKISKSPILMITVRNEKEDIIKALDCGVDDYLVKPFSLDELCARVNNLFLRNKKIFFEGTLIKIKNVFLDLKRKNVFIKNEKIKLTEKEYKILALLMVNKDKVINRGEMARCFLKESKKSYHLLNMHILNIRKKLGDNLRLETVSGKGFIVRSK
jgi:DNA-binding response OmpR family regulator